MSQVVPKLRAAGGQVGSLFGLAVAHRQVGVPGQDCRSSPPPSEQLVHSHGTAPKTQKDPETVQGWSFASSGDVGQISGSWAGGQEGEIPTTLQMEWTQVARTWHSSPRGSSPYSHTTS
jgi:hypothetical protein